MTVSAYIPRIDILLLDAEGAVKSILREWESAELTHSLDNVTPTAVLTAVLLPDSEPQEILEAATDKVQILVDGIPQITGYVNEVTKDNALGHPTFVASVAGCSADMMRSSIPEGFEIKGMTVQQVVEQLASPWGLFVVPDCRAMVAALTYRRIHPRVWDSTTLAAAGNERYLLGVGRDRSARRDDLSRLLEATWHPGIPAEERWAAASNIVDWYNAELMLTNDDYRNMILNARPRDAVGRLVETKESRDLHPQGDEVIGPWLKKFLEFHGLRITEDPFGNLVLYTPDYEISPTAPYIYSGDPSGEPVPWSEGIILSSSRKRRIDVVTDALFIGRGKFSDPTRIRVEHHREGANPGRYVLNKQVDTQVRDLDAATKKIKTVVNEADFNSFEYKADVEGYGTGNVGISVGQMIRVFDRVTGVNENLYVTERTISFSASGPVTSIVARRPGAWITDPSG